MRGPSRPEQNATLKAVRPLVFLALGVLCAPPCPAQSTPLLDVLRDELQRNFTVLKQKADPPPHYMAYEVTELESNVISASAGAITNQSANRARHLDVTVRVGTPKLDSYHAVRGERPHYTSGAMIPLDDDPVALKQRLWSETDRVYRSGAQRLISIKTDAQVSLADDDPSDDFAPAPAAVSVSAPPRVAFSVEEWSAKARKWSSGFAKYPGALAASVAVLYQRDTRSFVNSEGSRIQSGRGYARIVISAQAKAFDGMDLATSETFEAAEPMHLPSDAAVQAAVDKVGKQLTALLDAPVVEPYIGPAILSGRASGVFFHEIFGHRIEGHRQKDTSEGQTFTKSVNTPVLPTFLSVVFDPTRPRLGTTDLNGTYQFDDEGVQARPVTLVDRGVLKTFLLSRSPIKDFPQSNGHGRRQPGLEVVSRQSNLIVESGRQVTDEELRQQLIAEVKRQGKPYGLFLQQVTGGYTTTQRRGVQAFKVMPVVVYRVYPDGRPDELVRGADIVGTPLASFARILATSDRSEVFNGYCGAESGSVPVSAVSPAILVSELEVQKRERSQDRPPLLPRPAVGGAE